MTKPFFPKPVATEHQYQPTPRFRYEGDVHPITGERVFRQDVEGYKAAYRTILRNNSRHPALKNKELWPEMKNGSMPSV